VKEGQDAYGRMILDALEHEEPISEIVERDDGFMMASRFGTELYLAPFRRWPARQRRAMRLARGRILDAGAGGGRVALHLQQRGLDVVAIDVSPLAVETCRRRGVRDARVIAVEHVDESLGVFDTIVMFGNNLGLVGASARSKRVLERLHRVSSRAARILGESLDPYTTDDPRPPRLSRAEPAARPDGRPATDPDPLSGSRDAMVRLPVGLAGRARATAGRNGLALGPDDRGRAAALRGRDREGCGAV
jgi:SAM-dependent methyltransferase